MLSVFASALDCSRCPLSPFCPADPRGPTTRILLRCDCWGTRAAEALCRQLAGDASLNRGSRKAPPCHAFMTLHEPDSRSAARAWPQMVVLLGVPWLLRSPELARNPTCSSSLGLRGSTGHMATCHMPASCLFRLQLLVPGQLLKLEGLPPEANSGTAIFPSCGSCFSSAVAGQTDFQPKRCSGQLPASRSKSLPFLPPEDIPKTL